MTTVPQATLIKCCGCAEESNCYSDISCNEIFERINKLKSYEDTGLEPDEVKELVTGLRAMGAVVLTGTDAEEWVAYQKSKQN